MNATPHPHPERDSVPNPSSADPPDPAGALQTACASCGYALTGLSERGACPECGQQFDRRSLLMTRRGLLGADLVALLWTIFAGVICWGWWAGTASRREMAVEAGILVFTAITGRLWRVWSRDRATDYLLIGPLGVSWQLRGADSATFEWKQITTLRFVAGWRIFISLKDSKPDAWEEVPSALLGTPRAYEKVTAYLRRAAERYGQNVHIVHAD